MAGPDPQILDLAFLRRQTAGDVALEHELLRLLLDQCAALLPLLSSNEGSEARRDAAHSLRGAAAGLGADRLAATAAAIERGDEPATPVEQVVAELRDLVDGHLAHGSARPGAV